MYKNQYFVIAKIFNSQKNLIQSIYKMEQRNVIIHCHIFKNAGSTLDSALLQNFDDSFVDHREDHLIRNNKTFFNNYLQDNPHIKAFSSHSVFYTPKSFDNIVLHPIYLLRHPIERIKSVYNFEKIQPEEDSLGAKMAKDINFKSYVAWRMRDDVSATTRNLQTIFLGGIGPHESNIEEKFESALINLNSLPLIGIVDRYDESMVVFENYLKPFYPEIDLSYIRRNVTDTDTESTIDEKVLKTFNLIPKELRKEVIQKNECDKILYDAANKLLDIKIKRVKDFDEKYSKFKLRCLTKELNQLIRQEEFQKVEKICLNQIKKGDKGQSISFYINLGIALKGLNKYDEALDLYEDIKTKFPRNPWTYFYLAELKMQVGKKKEAMNYFEIYENELDENPKVSREFSKLFS